MNYEKIYNDLIRRGKNRVLESYKERHHIIPKSMGGLDNIENLVYLTPEEHYLAHQLLIRIYPKNTGLVRAAMMMCVGRTTNKIYGWLRRRHSVVMRESQTGDGNSQYGKKWIHNKDLRLSRKIQVDENLPNGWEIGRIIDFDLFFKNQELKLLSMQQRSEKVLTNEQIQKKIKTKHFNFRKSEGYRKAKSLRLYGEFKVSNLSLRAFAKNKKIVPMTLSKWFNEFIDEYNISARIPANKQIK